MAASFLKQNWRKLALWIIHPPPSKVWQWQCNNGVSPSTATIKQGNSFNQQHTRILPRVLGNWHHWRTPQNNLTLLSLSLRSQQLENQLLMASAATSNNIWSKIVDANNNEDSPPSNGNKRWTAISLASALQTRKDMAIRSNQSLQLQWTHHSQRRNTNNIPNTQATIRHTCQPTTLEGLQWPPHPDYDLQRKPMGL